MKQKAGGADFSAFEKHFLQIYKGKFVPSALTNDFQVL